MKVTRKWQRRSTPLKLIPSRAHGKIWEISSQSPKHSLIALNFLKCLYSLHKYITNLEIFLEIVTLPTNSKKYQYYLLTYLLTYFDHTASQAIGTEMHAYTIGNVHAIELRSSKNNEQNLRGIITLLSSFLAFIHNRRQFVYSLVQVAKSCVDSCTVTWSEGWQRQMSSN